MKTAFLMQEMDATDPKITGSLLLIQEAVRRGYEVYHFTIDTITAHEDKISALTAPVTVNLADDHYFSCGPYAKTNLNAFDIIWFRQLPPVDEAYIATAHLFDRLYSQGVYITNIPQSLLTVHEKISALQYPDLMPPTLVTRHNDEVRDFLDHHKKIIAKPLNMFGTHNVEVISEWNDAERFLKTANAPMMFQKFLPDVESRQKRMTIINGALHSMYLQKHDGTFLNAANRRHERYEPQDEDVRIFDAIQPLIQKHRIDLAGVDLIGSDLLEINITCPGSLILTNRLYDCGIEKTLWDCVEGRYEDHQDAVK